MPKTKPKKTVIKSIIFDLGGVIMHGGYLDFIHQYCLECLTPNGKIAIAELERQVNVGLITETVFYKQIKKIFGVQLTPKQMHTIIVHKMKPDAKLLAFIPKLRKAKIALFSNSIGFMARDVLQARHIPTKKIFDKTFFSNVLHLAKPDDAAYVAVLKSLKIKSGQALLIDDRPENIRAAKKLGMHGIAYKNFTQFSKEIKKYDLT